MRTLLKILSITALSVSLVAMPADARGRKNSQTAQGQSHNNRHQSGASNQQGGQRPGGNPGNQGGNHGNQGGPNQGGNHGGQNQGGNHGNHGGQNQGGNHGNQGGPNHGGNHGYPGGQNQGGNHGNHGGPTQGGNHGYPGGQNHGGNHGNSGNIPGGNQGNHGGYGYGYGGGNQYYPGSRPGYGYGYGYGSRYGYVPQHVPHRPYMPAHSMAYCAPTPPPGFRAAQGRSLFGSILGVTIGTAIGVTMDYLLGNGYDVTGYTSNAVYLNNVSQLNMLWPNATLYYGTGGMLQGSEFVYSTPYFDQSRYNTAYSYLVRSYGAPISTMPLQGGGIRVNWFGYNGQYVSLQYQQAIAYDGSYRYFTTLSFGI